MGTEKKRIILVDADPSRGAQLAGIFSELNFEVVAKASGKEALSDVEQASADIVLASADGPSAGFDLCNAIRKNRKVKKTPVVVLSSAPDADSQFSRHQKKGALADGYVKCPAPPEDIVDWVEKLVGLPQPPNGSQAMAAPVESSKLDLAAEQEIAALRKEVQRLQDELLHAPAPSNEAGSGEQKREIEELQEQVNFYQRQLEQVSIAGEKESRQFDQVLNDLQDELDKVRKERDKIREELQLTKSDLSKRDRELRDKEQQLGDAKTEVEQEKEDLRAEVESLKAESEDRDEKHKRAQNALRDYYKPKLDGVKKLKATVSALEDELVRLTAERKDFRKQIEAAENKVKSMEEGMEKEKERAKKAREALENAAKAFSE